MKPKKVLYEDQQAAWNFAIREIHKIIDREPCVKEAYIWASLAEGTFGTYETKYKDKEASDIDLVIIVDETKLLPTAWRDMKLETGWFHGYKIGSLRYLGNEHQIDGLLVFPSRHDLNRMQTRLQGRSKQIHP